jgi:hypothetical protein
MNFTRNQIRSTITMNTTTFEKQYQLTHDSLGIAMIHDRLSHPAEYGFEQDDAGAGHCLLVAERIVTLKSADTGDAEILVYLRASEVDPFDIDALPGTGILAAVSYLNALLDDVEAKR